MSTPRLLTFLALLSLPWLLLLGESGVALYGMTCFALVVGAIVRDLWTGRAP